MLPSQPSKIDGNARVALLAACVSSNDGKKLCTRKQISCFLIHVNLSLSGGGWSLASWLYSNTIDCTSTITFPYGNTTAPRGLLDRRHPWAQVVLVNSVQSRLWTLLHNSSEFRLIRSQLNSRCVQKMFSRSSSLCLVSTSVLDSPSSLSSLSSIPLLVPHNPRWNPSLPVTA